MSLGVQVSELPLEGCPGAPFPGAPGRYWARPGRVPGQVLAPCHGPDRGGANLAGAWLSVNNERNTSSLKIKIF